ncbi:hypothetical protein QO000_002793 [Alkalihalobacillus hemicentroti]|uniref:Uncharacterized protein n=1 Tax=Guptibacillus hwajinpoensis TaxID=208199 RepID=A0ABU0K3E8_9BACL|nr:hypothetical protein [Alkalihalobacillus hemicentroti]
MGLILAVLTILSSAGFLYYMGKSGYKWDSDEKGNKEES